MAETEQAPSVRGKFVIYVLWMLFLNDNNDFDTFVVVVSLNESTVIVLYIYGCAKFSFYIMSCN